MDGTETDGGHQVGREGETREEGVGDSVVHVGDGKANSFTHAATGQTVIDVEVVS